MYFSKGYAPASFLKDINKPESLETAIDSKGAVPNEWSSRSVESSAKVNHNTANTSSTAATPNAANPPQRVAPTRPRPIERPTAAQTVAATTSGS